MITGHIGIAFGARALDRREGKAGAPLLWLLAATVAPDVVDGLLSAGNYCNPEGALSHSLPVVAVLGVLFGTAAWLHTRSEKTALLVGLMVLMHLPPDYITGRKALWPGGPVWGLYIYRWPWLDFLIEVPVVFAGWWMLRRTTFTPRWIVSWVTLVFLFAVQGAFAVSSTVYGPQPPRACGRPFP